MHSVHDFHASFVVQWILISLAQALSPFWFTNRYKNANDDLNSRKSFVSSVLLKKFFQQLLENICDNKKTTFMILIKLTTACYSKDFHFECGIPVVAVYFFSFNQKPTKHFCVQPNNA